MSKWNVGKIGALCFGLMFLVIMGCRTPFKTSTLLTIPGATYVGDKTCLNCHEDVVSAFKNTAHGKIADFEVIGKKGCE
ncbi:MAG: hypothetical protein DRG37_03975, partial [Deltaproteobacteria bacterium]